MSQKAATLRHERPQGLPDAFPKVIALLLTDL